MTSNFKKLALMLGIWSAIAPTHAEEIYWVGYQNDCMVAHPDAGSFFHGDNWLNYTVPGATDIAKFGTGDDPQDNGDRPHFIHFGDFCLDVFACPNDIAIPGGDVINDRLEIQSGSWTFDFGTGSVGACSLPGSTTGNYHVAGSIVIGTDVESTGLPGTAALALEGAGGLSTDWALYLGHATGSSGELTVAGSETSLDAGAYVNIGWFGDGVVELSEGGILTSAGASIGEQPGATGHVTAAGPGTVWTDSRPCCNSVGWSGVGTLEILDGAEVTSAFRYIGAQPGAIGSIVVAGIGSTWSSPDFVALGGSGSGSLTVNSGAAAAVGTVFSGIDEGGIGVLDISNGGSLTSSNADLGVSEGASGVADVTGNESEWAALGWLNVGLSGVGELVVSEGGTVSVAHASVGELASGRGTLTVTGSTLQNGGELRVGWLGDGTVELSEGGNLTSVGASIGAQPGATGLVTVSGPGTIWADSAPCCNSVGWAGVGTLKILDGAEVTSAFRYIGAQPGAMGSIIIAGIGSTWSSPDFVVLGGSGGTGVLALSEGGVVEASRVEVEHGVLKGDGTIVAPVLNSARVELGQSIGVLTIDGTFAQTTTGVLEVDLQGTNEGTEHDQMIVTGNASLGGTLEVVLIDGFVPSAGDVFEIITASAVSGEFADYACPDLGGGLSLNLVVNADGVTLEVGTDCNGNCVDDTHEIATGLVPDCNENGMPDECDIADGTSSDCNHNAVPDECDIDAGTSQDVDGDGVPDECVFWHPTEGPGLQLWSDPTNWVPQIVPDNAGENTYSVTIGGASQTATLDIDAEVNTLRLLDSDTLNVTMGNLTLESSFGMLNDGTVIVGDTHALTVATALPIAGGGDVRLGGPDALVSSASFGDTLINQVAIAGEGVIDADFQNDASVTADVTATTLKVTGTMPKVNNGTFQATNGATLEISDANVSGSGTYIADGGTISLLRGLGGGMIAGESMDVFNSGVFGVGWDAVVDLAGTFAVTGCGSYHAVATPVSASLTAGEILVLEDPAGAGEMLLEGTMSVESVGSITVGGEGSPELPAEACTPPRLKLSEAATVTAQNMNILSNGAVEAVDGVDIAIQQSLTLQAGSYTRGSGALPSDATLTAESVTIASVFDVGEGLMVLEDGMSVETTGDFVMAVDPDCVGASPAEGCTPPRVVAIDGANMVIGSNIVIPEDADITVTLAHNDANPPFALAGHFDNGSVNPLAFHWEQGPVTLNGGGAQQLFEVAGADLGPAMDGFDNNFAMGTVEAAGGTNVMFVDVFANQPTPEGVCGEALYVHTLLIRPGSAVTVDNCRVYAELVINEGGTIELLGCGSLEVLCPGNFGGDCPLNLTDFAAFHDCFTGPGGPIAQDCAPADMDHDGDVDLFDFAEFQAAFGTSGE